MPTSRVTAPKQSKRKSPPAAAAARGARGPIAEAASRRAAPGLVEPEKRQLLIAEAAYYLAEKRGFAPGGELQDWLQAEAELEVRFRA